MFVSVIKFIFMNPILLGILCILSGALLVIIGVFNRLKGRLVCAEVVDYIEVEKTEDEKTEVWYAPVVSFHIDGEDMTMPTDIENREKKFEIGKIIDVLYVKNEDKALDPDIHYVFWGAGLVMLGIFAFWLNSTLKKYFDGQAHTWFCVGIVILLFGIANLLYQAVLDLKGKEIAAADVKNSLSVIAYGLIVLVIAGVFAGISFLEKFF